MLQCFYSYIRVIYHLTILTIHPEFNMHHLLQVRLIRANCVRLVTEIDNSTKLYYNVENTREYHEIGDEPNFLELDEETVPSVVALIQAYPKYIKVEELPILAKISSDLAKKMRVAQDLWERRLLITRECLEAFKFDDDQLMY